MIKTSLAGFLALIMVFGARAQAFEGEVTYTVKYVSKNPKASDQQLGHLLGTWQSYVIKGASYKTTSNGKISAWQIYNSSDNRIYTKSQSSETVFWINAADQRDEVLKAELNKNAAKVLSYKCDELVLTCKSGVQKYYFSSEIPLDAEVFKNHKQGNWYDYVQRAGAVPLKSIIETDTYTRELTATEVKPKKIDDNFFKLPLNAQLAPSPF